MADLSQGVGGFHFTKYQLAYLADPSARILTNKARRIGFTECAAFKRAQRAVGIVLLPGRPFEKVQPVPQNIFSAGKSQAKAALGRITKWIRVLEAVFALKLIKDDGLEVVRLRNGIDLMAFSSSSRTARGFEGDLMLDEYAHMPKQREVWKAVSPLAGRNLRNPYGYQIDVISTPNGDDDHFHELWSHPKNQEAWSRHEVNLLRAIAEGFTVYNDDGEAMTAEDLRLEIGDDDLFAQEYMCSFLASSMRYISAEVWDNACYDPDEHRFEGRDQGVYGGMDVGAGGHESVIIDLERYGEALFQASLADRRRERDWDKQEDWARSGMQRRTRFAIDTTGIGDQFGQRMEKAFPGRVDSVKFTLAVKEELVSGLKLGLSRKVLRPIIHDTDLRRDALSLRRIITAMGNVRYDAEQTKKRHADGAWAIALGLGAAGGAAKERAVTTKVSTPKATEISGPRQKRGAWR